MYLTISADKEKLDIPLIHKYLSEDSYWAKNIPLEILEGSIEGSLAFGVYLDGAQVGFARIITDKATFAYLADVFILPEHHGKGFAGKLLDYIIKFPELQGLRRWMLATRDAHELYRRVGFKETAHPEWFMEIAHPNLYQKSGE